MFERTGRGTLLCWTWAFDTTSFDKKDLKLEYPMTDRIENMSEFDNDAQLAELSGIEAEAASKAAWLVTLATSLGGLLFGESVLQGLTMFIDDIQATTLATSPQYLSRLVVLSAMGLAPRTKSLSPRSPLSVSLSAIVANLMADI
jgi:hypothetical protein